MTTGKLKVRRGELRVFAHEQDTKIIHNNSVGSNLDLDLISTRDNGLGGNDPLDMGSPSLCDVISL